MILSAKTHITAKTKVEYLEVYQSDFSVEAKEALRRVGSPARWDKVKWCWSYPLTPAAVEALVRAADGLGATVEWEPGLREYADKHLESAKYEHQTRLAIERIIRDESTPVPDHPTNTIIDGKPVPPMRHQKIAFQWSQRVTGLLLGHDPGLGKTRSATDAACGWLRNGIIRPMTLDRGRIVGGVLIVGPKTMVRTWEKELRQWQNATGLPIVGESADKKRLALTPAHFHIINYEGLRYVADNHYDGLIFDEHHRLANHTNQMTYCLKLASRATRKLGLSGTPLANNLESIFYPMLILDGGRSLGASKTAFLERFFDKGDRAGPKETHEPKEGALQAIANAVATNVYWLKKEDALDLPAKTFTPMYLDMTPEQSRYYQQCRKETIAYLQDSTVTLDQVGKRMMKLMQICQGFARADDGQDRSFTDAKTDALMDLLDGPLQHRKTIVWAYFNHEIDMLRQRLTARGIKHVVINGQVTSQHDRNQSVERWNTEDDLTVYVRQYSMSEGVTLLGTKANPCWNAVYMGISYRYVDWLQSQDRIHRIGQRWPVHYNVLLTSEGVDRGIYDKVLSKVQTAADFREMSKDTYLDILKA